MVQSFKEAIYERDVLQTAIFAMGFKFFFKLSVYVLTCPLPAFGHTLSLAGVQTGGMVDTCSETSFTHFIL